MKLQAIKAELSQDRQFKHHLELRGMTFEECTIYKCTKGGGNLIPVQDGNSAIEIYLTYNGRVDMICFSYLSINEIRSKHIEKITMAA